MIHRFAEEAGAGYRSNAHFLREVDTEQVIGLVAEFADIHHHEVRTLRFSELETQIAQAAGKDFLHVRVSFLL